MIQETESLCRSEQCKAIVACFAKQYTAVNSTACNTVKNWVLEHLRAERLDFCTVNSFGLVVIIRPKGRVEVVKSYPGTAIWTGRGQCFGSIVLL